ncbi:MAG: class I SAM-dependent methyltransferase [Reyranella sp.]|nr:class I SAM-dependent methyltransferase [Reyranella sp.]
MDLSEEFLRLAEERARKAPMPIDLLKSSREALPLEDKSVDTVAMTFAHGSDCAESRRRNLTLRDDVRPQAS